MSNFEVKILPLKIEDHPDPETTSLEVGKIGDYSIVVKKGLYKSGDLVAYIPEQSIVPDNILQELSLTGRLAGSNKNRVKAIKLRGVMSQGIVYPSRYEWKEGQDVADLLGITKYNPPIPVHLMGEMGQAGINFTFDIENIKKYPDVFKEDEQVVFTEKLHGTFCCIGFLTEEYRKTDMFEGKFFISSKGLASKGLYFKDNKNNKNNTYVKSVLLNDLLYKMNKLIAMTNVHNELANVWLCGEVLGVQKGFSYGSGEIPKFRAFGIKTNNRWLNFRDFSLMCSLYNIESVPVLYRGPYSKEKLLECTSGKETLTGNETHIREGLVVTPVIERYDLNLGGRVILKSVSDAYLGKSDGEEIQ